MTLFAVGLVAVGHNDDVRPLLHTVVVLVETVAGNDGMMGC